MKHHIKEYQFFNKALLLMTVSMIVVVFAFFLCYSYQHNIAHAEKEKLNTLQSIAKNLTLVIDGDMHEQIMCNQSTKNKITSNTENKEYFTIHSLLKKAQAINGLKSPIYTLIKNDVCGDNSSEHKILMGVTSTEPYFKHSFSKSPKYLHENFETGGTIGQYSTENGTWLSAFHPVKNSAGKTIAVIQTDERFDAFIKMAQQKLIKESLLLGLVLALLSIGFIFSYRWLLSGMNRINKNLDQVVHEKTEELNKSNLALKNLNEKLENIVQERTKALEISNEKLKAFARVASHDLQAPLRSIKGFGQLLKRRYGKTMDKDGNEFLDFITTNSQTMSDLIKEILNTSLLPSENSAEISAIDLNRIVETVQLNLKTDIEKSQTQITYNNLPTIDGFRSDFIQLFQNFISNSIKYNREGVPPEIEIKSQQVNECFSIKISDNGRGISDEAMTSILDEFDRGDSTDNDGYGIGLATCQRILKGYDGLLDVYSEVGVGTCFTMTLKNKSERIESHADAVEVALGAALKN